MFMGHYATALIPYEKLRTKTQTPFWVFLLAAQFLDLLMMTLVLGKVESLAPQDRDLARFHNMQTDMFVSHDILPVLGWAFGFAAIAWLLTKERIVALWCAALILFHELLDYLVGFEHRIFDERLFGTNSEWIGLNLYHSAPILGLVIEALLCIACIVWFFNQRSKKDKPVSMRLKIGLPLLLVGGCLAAVRMAL